MILSDGFRKVKSVECADQPASSLWEFRHPSFLRGQPHLLSEIKRAMHYGIRILDKVMLSIFK